MNLILTSVCNKRCSFCFAKQYVTNPEIEVFDLDFVKTLLEEASQIQTNGQVKEQEVKLLGGEPTIYPHFVELMEWLTSKAEERKTLNQSWIKICIVSNFLFRDEKVGKSIDEYAKAGHKFSCLINTAEMNEEQKILVAFNIKSYVLNHLNAGLTLGFTLNCEYSFDYYKDNLDYLYDEVIKNRPLSETPVMIRLSLQNPEAGKTTFEEMLEKKTLYGRLINGFVEWGIDHRTKVKFDCGIFYCMFDKSVQAYLTEWAGGNMNGCNGGAEDIFPDGKMINCYPGSIIQSNYHKYKSILPTMKEITNKTNLFRSIAQPPKTCQSCEYYLKQCKGPCLGYFNVTTEEEREIIGK